MATRAEKRLLKEARTICEREFEPLWRPAASLAPRPATLLEAADRKSAAQATAFAWLAAKLGRKRLTSFGEIDNIEDLRRAYTHIWHATLFDVRRWADQIEEAA